MKDVFKQTLRIWGNSIQVTTAMEELGELIAALNRYFFRSRIQKKDLASEIADVEIVCMQLREIIGNELIDEIKYEKIERLKARIREAKKKMKG